MKKCSRCAKTKPLNEFSQNRTRPDRKSVWCKVCIRDKYLEMREIRLEKAKKYRQQNLEKVRSKIKEWQDANRDKIKRDARARYKKNKESIRVARTSKEYKDKERNGRLKTMYGMTLAEYHELLDEQNGVCAICGGVNKTKKSKWLDVDHDHATGNVRGLLCDHCNNALGRIQDNPNIVLKMYEYLKMFEYLMSYKS